MTLLGNRAFVALTLGGALSSIGTHCSSIALPLLVLALTGSPVQAGIATALQWLPFVLFALPAGAVGDRWVRRDIMHVCELTRGVAFAAIPLLFAFGHFDVRALYVVAVVEGIGSVFYDVSQISTLPDVVPPSGLARATSVAVAVSSGTLIVGPALGGVLVAAGTTRVAGGMLAYGVDAASYGASFVLLLFVPRRRHVGAERVGSVRADLEEGVRWFKRSNTMRKLALLGFVFNLAFYPTFLALTVLVCERLGHSPSTLGVLQSIGCVGGVVGALLLPPFVQRAKRTWRAVVVISIAYALAFALLAGTTELGLLALALALRSATLQAVNAVTNERMLAAIPEALRGRVTSIVSLLDYIALPVGALAGGVLLHAYSPRVVLAIVAVVMLGGVLVVRLDRLDSAP